MEVEAHRGVTAASLHVQEQWRGEWSWCGVGLNQDKGSRQTCRHRVMMGVEVVIGSSGFINSSGRPDRRFGQTEGTKE